MGKKSTIIATVVSMLACMAVTVWTCFADFEKSFYLMSVLIIIFAIVPFFAYFEGRKIKTTEIVTLAMMITISTVSRVAFAFVPQVKPMAALVMVTGVAFGANAGFITGALSIFASNFVFGQGLYTPFQMFAMGLVGLFGGVVFHRKKYVKNKWIVSFVGFILVFVLYGIIVDTCSVFMMATELSLFTVLDIYVAGIPMNLIHAVTTFVVLLLINNPMNNKFERLRIKYGVFDR